MKKYLIFWIGLLLATHVTLSLATQPVFTVTQNTRVIQNMVAGSTQNLVYTINVPVPPPKNNPIFINCNLQFDSQVYVTAPTFLQANGCANPSGVAISQQTGGSVLVNIALIAGSSSVAAGHSTTGTLTFTQVGGRGTKPVVFSIPISIPTTSNRTVTFNNYCPYAVWFGVSSGSIPGKTAGTIPCTSNSDCSFSAYSTCTGGFCGGGACHTSTDCTVTSDPNSPPNPNDPPVCNNGSCSYCLHDSDCVAGGSGSSCNLTNHQCYWNTPAPSDASTNHYKLAAYSGSGNPASDSITLTDYSSTDGFSLLWSGGFAGRTKCGSTAPYTGANACLTAGCNVNGSGDGNGGCNLGEGFSSPSTQAEVTFVSLTPDTYDVTIINGTNIPVAMHPNNAATPQAYNNPFNCGNTGGATATVLNPPSTATTLGACSWNFMPPSVAYRWVDTDASPTTNCTSDTTCTTQFGSSTKFRCGLTSTAVGTTGSGSGQTICGTPLGYWNQNEICAMNATYNPTDVAGVVNCTETGFNGGANTLINLLACTGGAGTSCYTSGAGSACGGCTNWSMLTPGSVPSDPAFVTPCTTPNSDWVNNVLTPLEWLKQACPSAYVYPFDDKASTFTCPQNGGQSAVNYSIDFCPGGEAGGIPA